jgi:hypothetical protein
MNHVLLERETPHAPGHLSLRCASFTPYLWRRRIVMVLRRTFECLPKAVSEDLVN